MSNEKVAEAYRRYDVAKMALQGTAVVLLLCLAGWQLFQEARAEEQRANSRAVLQILAECTTPPSERKPPVKVKDPQDDCFTRNQARTGQAVGQIGDLSILAAACGAANPGDVPATRECVENAMEKP